MSTRLYPTSTQSATTQGATAFPATTFPASTKKAKAKNDLLEIMLASARNYVWGLGAAGVTLLLGLWNLSVPTPHFDEPTYAEAGRLYLEGDLNNVLTQPPLATYAFGIAQLIFGEGVPSARLASLLAGTLTTFLIWLIASKITGQLVGTLTAFAWAILPQSLSANEVSTIIERPETIVLLEAITTMWMVAAIWAGLRALTDKRWRWMLLVGAFVGLAAASKLTGAWVGPPIVVAVLLARKSRLAWKQGAVAALASAVVWAATFAPYGSGVWHAWSELWRTTQDHLEEGHLQFVGGAVYHNPPWWTPFWHHLDADGLLLSAVLVGLVVWSIPRWRRPEVAMIVGCAVVMFAVLCLSSAQLRHYRYVSLPMLYLLAGVGAQVMWTRAENFGRLRMVSKPTMPVARVMWTRAEHFGRVARAGVVGVLGVVVAYAGVAIEDRITLEPVGYAAVGEYLEVRGFEDRWIHVYGSPHLQQYYLPDQVVGGGVAAPVPADAVVVTEQNWWLRFPAEREAITVENANGEPVPLRLGRDGTQLGPITIWPPSQ